MVLCAGGVARAQAPPYTPPAPMTPVYTPPVYIAQPPTPGALYQDGQTGRYLLGGTWLYRPDLTDVGLAQGWWRNVAATNGWSRTPTTQAISPARA